MIGMSEVLQKNRNQNKECKNVYCVGYVKMQCIFNNATLSNYC